MVDIVNMDELIDNSADLRECMDMQAEQVAEKLDTVVRRIIKEARGESDGRRTETRRITQTP